MLEGAPGVLAYAIGLGTRCTGHGTLRPPCRVDLPCAIAPRVDSPEPDAELTGDHMRLLERLHQHPSGSLIAAAQEFGLDVTEVEALCAELVAAGMIERVREQ